MVHLGWAVHAPTMTRSCLMFVSAARQLPSAPRVADMEAAKQRRMLQPSTTAEAHHEHERDRPGLHGAGDGIPADGTRSPVPGFAAGAPQAHVRGTRLMAAWVAGTISFAPRAVPSKGFGTYRRVQRFLNGHHEELLPELLVL